MRSQRQIIEDMNYYNDERVNAKPVEGFNEENMTITVFFDEYEDDNGNIFSDESVELPARFEVCDLCNGKGKHTNPSIDCCGLTREDFAEDPDFAESYFAGHYDVTCNQCNGNRVSPVIDEDQIPKEGKMRTLLKAYYLGLADDAAYEAKCIAERIMGA